MGQREVLTVRTFSVLSCEEKNLVDHCWKVIDEQAEEGVRSEGFATIERSLLETVVERDPLNIQETELFKAVNLWATKRCEEKGLSTDGSEKRKFLGERIVKGIRFPVMTQDEFAAVVLDCKILTQDEAFSLVKYLNSVPDTPLGFSEKKRTSSRGSFQRAYRFHSVVYTDSGYPYAAAKRDCLLFEVDKDISLLGVTLCGSKNDNYAVSIQIKCLDNGDWNCICSKTGKFSSVCIESELVCYYGFNIFFDSPVITKSKLHRIEASICGANSCCGVDGSKYVLCSGVTFSFSKSSESRSGTRVERGQFPEFLFSVI